MEMLFSLSSAKPAISKNCTGVMSKGESASFCIFCHRLTTCQIEKPVLWLTESFVLDGGVLEFRSIMIALFYKRVFLMASAFSVIPAKKAKCFA